MRTLLWLLALVGALLGGLLLFASFLLNQSAPQQAAAAGIAVGLAAIPYVLARAWDELKRQV